MVVAYLGHEEGISKKGQAFAVLYYAYSSAKIHGQGADAGMTADALDVHLTSDKLSIYMFS